MAQYTGSKSTCVINFYKRKEGLLVTLRGKKKSSTQKLHMTQLPILCIPTLRVLIVLTPNYRVDHKLALRDYLKNRLELPTSEIRAQHLNKHATEGTYLPYIFTPQR
uniref:Uncharacterized protein n=1 Tax=Cacopsylla melanoneura TaxID=428564 RepID=A0A8D8M3U3_9HEMI